MQDDPPEDDTVKSNSRTFVNCGGCNKEVGYDAKTCPYCGKTLFAEWSWTLIVLYVALFTGVAILAYLSSDK